MKKIKYITLATALILGACATNFAPGFYTPQLTEELKGDIAISTFESSQAELTQKSEKAGMSQDMNIWLSEFFTDAITQEFMQMEAYDETSSCTLSGEIAYYNRGTNSVDLEVNYKLAKGSRTLFTTSTESKRPLNQSMQLQVAQTMLHRTMTDSVNQIVSDQKFNQTLSRNCR